MKRTLIGALIGGLAGFFAGVMITVRYARPHDSEVEQAAVFCGIALGSVGVLIGSVVGGVADILAFLRARIPAPVDLDSRGMQDQG